ncbi:MAG: RNA-binding protein [Methylophaga sp.]|nr:MAG: RNA-binding protein [Methylophaga sp.]
MAKQEIPPENNQRLDKWLWAARFFKTRGLAVEAINGGKIHLNNNRVKPSRMVKPDDVLNISKPPYEHIITVLGLSKQRRPAPEAQQLYIESEISIEKREKLREELKNQPLGFRYDKGRPNKRDRRHIIKFTRKE